MLMAIKTQCSRFHKAGCNALFHLCHNLVCKLPLDSSTFYRIEAVQEKASPADLKTAVIIHQVGNSPFGQATSPFHKIKVHTFLDLRRKPLEHGSCLVKSTHVGQDAYAVYNSISRQLYNILTCRNRDGIIVGMEIENSFIQFFSRLCTEAVFLLRRKSGLCRYLLFQGL